MVFSQQQSFHSLSSEAIAIEIDTDGLDTITLLTSNNETIAVQLLDENPNTHYVTVDDTGTIVKIAFKLDFIPQETVFRKFITKRLYRASAVVKLPKNKNITLHGKTIEIHSKNYQGNLTIYIDKGVVSLNEVQQNVVLKLFQGNVFATVVNSTIHIKSTNGNIVVNEKIYPKEYKKEAITSTKIVSISSIHANITLFENENDR